MNRKEVYRSVKVTDNVKLSALSVIDQIRLIASHLSNDDVAELRSMDKLSSDELRKQAGLTDFLSKAAEHMTENGTSSVTLAVASEFLPYIDEVIDKETGLGRFYRFEVFKRDIPFEVQHKFIVKIYKQVEGE